MKEAIGVGATPELALADACAKLGKESHEVEYELIEMAEKKLFGLFGGRPAKVRAYIPEDEVAEVAAVVEAVAAPAVTAVEVKAEVKAEVKTEVKAKVKTEVKAKVKTEVKAKEEAKAIVAEETVEDVPVVEEIIEDAPVAAEAAPAAEKKSDVNPADVAVDYLKKILKGLGAENLEVSVKEKEDGAELTLTGADAHMVIGHHGETLSALTYLVGLVANHVQDGYYRITINTGNYREKREQTLQRLAKRVAAKAVATGRKQSLEPMNPYERRIIHTAVQEVEGATSWSEGEDMNRHVVIGLAEGARPTRPRNNGEHNNRRGNPRNGNGNRRPDNRSGERKNSRPYNGGNGTNRPQITDAVSANSAPTEVRTTKPETRPAAKTSYKKESASVPLYGRIDVKK